MDFPKNNINLDHLQQELPEAAKQLMRNRWEHLECIDYRCQYVQQIKYNNKCYYRIGYGYDDHQLSDQMFDVTNWIEGIYDKNIPHIVIT